MATLDEVGVIRFAPKLAKKLIADWNTVESSLQSFGISCEHNKDDKLFMGEQTTIVRVFASSSTEMASVGKALTLFKLLSTTYLALPEAIQVALHRKPCVIIKTGINNGGFSKKYNIDKETFGKRHRDFAKHVQGNSLAVTGRSALGSSVGFMMVKRIAKGVFVQNVDPGYLVFKMEKQKEKFRMAAQKKKFRMFKMEEKKDKALEHNVNTKVEEDKGEMTYIS
ncbi:hypothetical protein M0R45_008397 [Rubus argutus]|uniref:Uncharacterized protein n=1 Tax=Rubus argutus TaxID=59490 RepID=A0AAW1Y4B1_RUBAR